MYWFLWVLVLLCIIWCLCRSDTRYMHNMFDTSTARLPHKTSFKCITSYSCNVLIIKIHFNALIQHLTKSAMQTQNDVAERWATIYQACVLRSCHVRIIRKVSSGSCSWPIWFISFALCCSSVFKGALCNSFTGL